MSRKRKKGQARSNAPPVPRNGAKPRRRRALVVATLALALIALGGLWFVRTHRVAGPVILISVDTLRADRLPIYGYSTLETPAFDGLARDGVVFDNAYSHIPLTLPSHSSVLTGLLPFEHGVRNNTGFTLAPSNPNIVVDLAHAGYSTGAAVSAFVLRPQTGISNGFGFFDADMGNAHPQFSIAEAQRDGAKTAQALIAWLDKQTGPKFFAFLHLYEPHAPYRPPQRYKDRYRSLYDGDVAYADEIVGTFLGELKKLGRYDESLIVLMSDHGEGLGDHGEQEHGVFLYREDLHVPLIVKFPRSQYSGRRVASPVGLIDIAPTIREWVGLARPDRQSGTSLLQLMDSDPAKSVPIYSESLYGRYHFGWKELYALTTSQYSYIQAPRDELYDIVKDPKQRDNRVAWEPDLRENMRSELDTMIASTEVAAPGETTAEELAAMEALGYVGAPSLTADENLPDPKDKVADLEQYSKAIGLLRHKDFLLSRDLLVDLLKKNPRMVDAWDRLSDVYERFGDIANAVEAQKKSLELSPERPLALIKMAIFLGKLQRFDEAILHGELAAKKMPGKAYMMLGRLCAFYGKSEKAMEFARKASATDPAALPYVEGLIAHKERRFPEAQAFLQKSVDELEKIGAEAYPDLNFYLADCLARAGETAEAERRFEQELEDHPLNVSAGVRLAALHMAEGNERKRDEVLEKLAGEFPAPTTYDAVSEAYAAFGLADKAKEWHGLAERSRGEAPGG